MQTYEYKDTYSKYEIQIEMEISELVKLTAIDFAEWIDQENYSQSVTKGIWVKYPNTFTTSELYNIFIKSEAFINQLKQSI